MNAAHLPPTLDAKTLALRLWWGRAVLAFTAAVTAAYAVMLVSWLVDGGAATADAFRTLSDSPTFWLTVIAALTVAPLVETGLMAWIIDLLSRSIRSRFTVVLLSALLWAGLHRLVMDSSGWYAFVPFLAFSLVYLKRSRGPRKDGFITASLSHLIYNWISAASMLVASYSR